MGIPVRARMGCTRIVFAMRSRDGTLNIFRGSDQKNTEDLYSQPLIQRTQRWENISGRQPV
jgi:hypothetical protein